jgi:D-3-phosphoglycerate dehydrogenase / 2-oxoglutarate reductase
MESGMKQKILITPRSLTKNGHPALGRLEEAGYELVMGPSGIQPDEETLIRLLPGCAGYLAGVETISDRVLAAAADLKVISRNGIGSDAIDKAAAERRNIKICVAPGANARGVAELAVGLMFSLIRSIPVSDRFMKSGEWKRFGGIEISGRTMGVVGCGQIGKQVIQMALGLGMNVLGYDVFQVKDFNPGPGFSFVDPGDLLAESDVVSLHCPMQEDGRPLLDGDAIGKMKKGAWLINTARAGLVDDESVLAALDNGHLSGFATDVFSKEPPEDRRLAGHPKVVATPHIGGFTDESVSRAVDRAVENLLSNL